MVFKINENNKPEPLYNIGQIVKVLITDGKTAERIWTIIKGTCYDCKYKLMYIAELNNAPVSKYDFEDLVCFYEDAILDTA